MSIRVPTRQELQILRIIWKRGESSVRDVYEQMRTNRSIAYTTVMTYMNLLERKGLLRKHQVGRAFLYNPLHSIEEILGEMLEEFVDRVFEGSVPDLLRTVRSIPRPPRNAKSI